MLHYRNHSAAFGKVLMGVQISKSEKKEFQRRLELVGFEYREETNNPAYKVFVGGE